jgi:hypothetical protein
MYVCRLKVNHRIGSSGFPDVEIPPINKNIFAMSAATSPWGRGYESRFLEKLEFYRIFLLYTSKIVFFDHTTFRVMLYMKARKCSLTHFLNENKYITFS